MANCYFCKKSVGQSITYPDYKVPLPDSDSSEKLSVCRKCTKIIKSISDGKAVEDNV